MTLGENGEKRNQSPFAFLENNNFWKFLPQAPEFKYPPLCERFFGLREASDLTGRKCVFLGVILQNFSGHAPGPPYNGRAFGTPRVDS